MKNWRRYTDVAEAYERIRAPQTSAIAADLVALAVPGIGSRVLDVGTGTGVGVAAAASAVGETGVAVGVDLSVEMVSQARRARKDSRLAAAEAIQLPFRDATFDLITANFVLHEFKRHDTALFDLIRVLRPTGKLAATSWVAEDDDLSATWRALVEETIGKELLRSTRRDAMPGFERFGDRARFEETLREAGLKSVRVERRSYRFEMTRDDYIEDQSTRAVGRFVREMLGAKGWESFLERARRAYGAKYGPEIHDSRDVLLALGTKP